jgi:hypothetical protein
MHRKLVVGSLFLSLAGCADWLDEVTPKEVPHFKAVAGKVAVEALGSTVSEVVGEIDSVLGQTGGGMSAPGSVNPPADLFKDDAKVAPAPGYRAAVAGDTNWTEWRGPEAGPDGLAGWYYREVTDTVWDYTASKQVLARWRYWLRFEPAHDIAADGVGTASATFTNYGWSSEEGPWSGWRYVVRFGVTSVSTNLDGSARPASVEGTWLWAIDATAAHYRGSKSDGKYTYVFGNAEHLFADEDRSDGEKQDPFMGLAVGESRSIDLKGTGAYSYTGQHADAGNQIVGTWYGAGKYTSTGLAKVTRTGDSTADAQIDYDYDGRGYWGQGAAPQAIDMTVSPTFAKGVTPAGEAWGVPQWRANAQLTPRDGLLFWHEGTGEITVATTWDVLKEQAAQTKIDAARAVLDDPNATAEQKTQANTDLSAAYDEQTAAYTKRDAQFRSRSKYLTWDGQEKTGQSVSCSAPTLAPDCPAQAQ